VIPAEDADPSRLGSSQLTPRAGAGPELAPGDEVGEYRVPGELGEGGFGTVYEATHPVIGKRVAVKVLHAQYSVDEGITSWFAAEARAVNQIRHGSIVDIFGFGALPDGRHYSVMELLEGVTLDAYLEQAGSLSVPESLGLLHPIALALSAAHEAGIAHRDLKPENVFLCLSGDAHVTVKLLDFGMAKLLGQGTQSTHKTRSGAPMGSPRYMSPEQCRGVAVDARTDVYSFGCLTYRLLTGMPPFEAATALELMMAHVSASPIPPSHRSPGVPSELDEPILKMLEKLPDARPATLALAMESLVAAAERAGQGPGHAGPPSALLLSLCEQARQPPPAASPSRAPVTPSRRVTPDATALEYQATTPSLPAPKGNWRRLSPWLVAAAALFALFGMHRHRSRAALQSQTTAPVAAPNPSPAPLGTAPPPLSDPSASDGSSPQVSITLRSAAPGADVLYGERLVGRTPGPIVWPRGETPVTFTLRSPKHAPTTVTVKPDSDQNLWVSLVPRPPKAAASALPRDLENPY